MSVKIFALLFALKVLAVVSLDQCEYITNFEVCRNNSRSEPSKREEIKFDSIFRPRNTIDIFELWKDFPKIFIPKENVSEKCAADVERLFSDAENLNLWALKSEFELNCLSL